MIAQAELPHTRTACREAIAKRRAQIQDCVGWLWPRILEAEIDQLQQHLVTLPLEMHPK